MHCTKVIDSIWRVQSESSDQTYLVDLEGVTPWGEKLGTCTCVSYAINRNRGNATCKHLRYVADSSALEREENEKFSNDQYEMIKAIESLKSTYRELNDGH